MPWRRWTKIHIAAEIPAWDNLFGDSDNPLFIPVGFPYIDATPGTTIIPAAAEQCSLPVGEFIQLSLIARSFI